MLRRRWFPWVVFGAAIVSLAPISLLLYLGAPKPGVGVNCGGIGFGETPCGWDAVGLVMIIFAPPFVIGFAALLLVSELFGPRFALARSVVALIGAACPLIATCVLLAVGLD